MTKLKISSNLALPFEAITQTIGILAKRGAGKTYTASVLAEEFVAAKLPFCVLDPTGAWWGLRVMNDSKPGLPVIIIGGKHGDLPLEPTAGKLMADLIVDNPGFYVLDMSIPSRFPKTILQFRPNSIWADQSVRHPADILIILDIYGP